MQAFEVGHFRLITGFHEGFKAHADQFDQAAAENSLLAEEVGFALFLEVGFDDARTTATDGGAVGQADFEGFAGGVLVNCDQARHAAAFDELAANRVAGAFWRHHDDVDIITRLDQGEMHVQAVGEGDRRTRLHVFVDVGVVSFGLQLIRHSHHDDVGPGGGFGDAHYLQAFAFGFWRGW